MYLERYKKKKKKVQIRKWWSLQWDQCRETKNHSYSSQQLGYGLVRDYVHRPTAHKNIYSILKENKISKKLQQIVTANLCSTSTNSHRFKFWNCRCHIGICTLSMESTISPVIWPFLHYKWNIRIKVFCACTLASLYNTWMMMDLGNRQGKKGQTHIKKEQKMKWRVQITKLNIQSMTSS